MKNMIFYRKIKLATLLLFSAVLLFAVGCNNNDEPGWNDTRYTENFQVDFDNPNPKTGLPYTEEELAELKYDPKKEDRFSTDNPVILSLILSKPIKEIKIIDGTDLSVLATVTTTEPSGDKYKVAVNTTLDELKVPEGGSKLLKFDIVYQDGSIGSIQFKVNSVVPLPPVSESLVGQWKFDDASNLTKATLGNDLVLGGGMLQSSVAGPEASNLAAQINMGSFYEVNHGLPKIGGERVNQFTLIYDVKLPAASFGSYSNLLQTLTDNSSDGATYIAPNGGIWSNGIGTSGSGTIKADTWHRIVITVGNADYRVYVDGAKIIGGSPGPDGLFSLALDKFLVFADDGGEDATIHVAELMLFDITFTNEQAADLPGVGEVVD